MAVLLAGFLAFTGPGNASHAVPTDSIAPAGVGAAAAVVLDGSTTALLWGRGAHNPRPMASTTKIMTALVVLSTPGVNLNRLVTIKSTYARYVLTTGASSAGLRAGDRLTVRQLLYALLLPSGCDAAYALADTFGTGATSAARTADFIRRMNARAAKLGLTRTRFASFDGLAPASQHYITPRSLARLTIVALRNATFAAVVARRSTQQQVSTTTGGTRVYTWSNSNRLLGTYTGLLGVKTGTSTAAGPCFVFAARRGDRYVVGVVLDAATSDARFRDARLIMDWAFS